MVRVALLDRDGVLNRDRADYVKSVPEVEVLPGARAAVAAFRAAGWLVYVVSNQSAVGRRLTTPGAVAAITARLEAEAGPFDGVFYCFHRPDEGCDCRKPAPALLHAALAAARRRGPVEECWMVGDSARDVAAARAAGCRTAVVLTGSLTAAAAREISPPPDVVAADVLAAARAVLAGRPAAAGPG